MDIRFIDVSDHYKDSLLVRAIRYVRGGRDAQAHVSFVTARAGQSHGYAVFLNREQAQKLRDLLSAWLGQPEGNAVVTNPLWQEPGD